MKQCILAFSCVLLLVPSIAQAAEPQTYEEVLEALQSSREAIVSWSSDTVMSMSMGGMTMILSGTMKGKGESLSSEISMDMLGQSIKMRSVTDADGIQWIEMDMMGETQVIKMDMGQLKELSGALAGSSFPGTMGGSPFGAPESPVNLLESYGEMYDMTLRGREDLDGIAMYILEGKLKESLKEMLDPLGAAEEMGFSMDKIVIYVGVDDGFVRKTVMLGADDTPFMTNEFMNVVLNPVLDDSLFEYTPPEGVEIMDMSKTLDGGLAGDQSSEGFGGKYNVGDMAPDFEAAGLDGTAFKLSDYRGKVVLLDFWATWCGPCVAELPIVIEAYETHHSKGFEIIGISLDDDRAALDNFLAGRPAMTWVQVFDGLGWESRIGELYGVNAIPHTLLLDKEGKVYAKDLRGPALTSTVAKLLAASE